MAFMGHVHVAWAIGSILLGATSWECQKIRVIRNQPKYSHASDWRLYKDKTKDTSNTPRIYAIGEEIAV
jgi:hypothetical protein